MKRCFTVLIVTVMMVPVLAYAHGGGCRKKDLPRCCHMDKKAGKVHCH